MNDIQVRGADFLARITEGVMHELRNALATIKEHADFLQDFLSTTDENDFPEKEMFSRGLSAIDEQVVRSAELATRLNTFARGPDEPASELDLNELLEILAYLSEPTARGKGVTLETIREDRPLIIVANPLKVQMVLFDCIDFLTRTAGTDGTLIIRPLRNENGELMVDFSSPRTAKNSRRDNLRLAASPGWKDLQESVKDIHGWIVLREAPGWFTVVFKRDLI
ncbi:MAG: hypothetical protein P8182_07670 [Deltaproteobacteria bacterium]